MKLKRRAGKSLQGRGRRGNPGGFDAVMEQIDTIMAGIDTFIGNSERIGGD